LKYFNDNDKGVRERILYEREMGIAIKLKNLRRMVFFVVFVSKEEEKREWVLVW